jgi:hypothetical protein
MTPLRYGADSYQAIGASTPCEMPEDLTRQSLGEGWEHKGEIPVPTRAKVTMWLHCRAQVTLTTRHFG